MIRSIMTAAMLIGLAGPAVAEEDEAAQAARWRELKSALFGDRAVIEDSNVVVLDAPIRALDASTVPIGVSMNAGSQMSGGVTKLWLVVDGNPSPVVGTFSFGPDGDPRSLRTRVRVDQYTLIHAVAETADGRLFSTAKYVKAAGGCSAPSTKDPQVAMSRLGEIRVRLEGGSALVEGTTATAQMLISHPNNNGMQMDQLTHNYIPPHYIQSITVTYGGTLVLSVDADISMSEDPAITFGLRLDGDGPLHVEVKDSAKGDYRRDFALLKGS